MRTLKHAVFFLLCSAVWLNLVAAQASREIKKSVPLDADGRLVIDTYKGSITITTWDRAEVDISARIEADDSMWDSRRDEEEKVQDTDVRIEGSGREVRLKSDYTKLKRRHRSFWDIFDGDTGSLPFVHYTITMPRTASLKIKDYKSETSVTDVKSDISLNTYKGNARLVGVEGSVDLETYKGDVRIEYSALGKANRFETYKGEIEITIPRGKGFDLEANLSRRGSLRSDFNIEERYRSKRDRSKEYRTSINGGGPILRLETYKGTYRLREG